MARKKCRWFLGIFQPLLREADPEIPVLAERERKKGGRGQRTCAYVHMLGMGMLRKIFRNMIVTVTRGTEDLTISITGSQKGRKSNKASVLSHELEGIRHFLLHRYHCFKHTPQARVHTSSCTSTHHCWGHFTCTLDLVSGLSMYKHLSFVSASFSENKI